MVEYGRGWLIVFAIIKRELLSYFSSAVGYVVLFIFFLFSGFYFYATCLMANSADMSYVFSNLFTVLIFLVPIVTMRLMSEEKKQKTDQLLFTSPVSLTSIVLGKYLSAMLVVSICCSVVLVYITIVSFFTVPNFGNLLGNIFGVFLFTGAFIAVGLFLSSITENQIIAAISTFTVGVFVLLLDTIAKSIPLASLSKALLAFSFMQRYSDFTSGILSLENVLFFVSFIFVFLFLTVRLLAKRK